jgi:parallel beta-helix repeat protein
MTRAFAFAAICFALAHSAAYARDIHVNNLAGDDTDNGASPESAGGGNGPYRTIAKALRNADKGDRIILANTGESYRESVTFQAGRNSGYAGDPLVLDGGGAILDGSVQLGAGIWEHTNKDIYRFRPPRMSHQQLFLDGRPAVRRHMSEDGRPPTLKPLEWCLFDGHIYFRCEKDHDPYVYSLSCAGQTVGITLYEVRNVTISNLIVQGFQLDGINAHDSAFNVTIDNVTARGNGRSGISVGGASRVRIEGCLVGNNGAAQVRTEGRSITEIVDSDLLDNTAPPLVQEGGQVNVIKSEAPTP